MTEIAPMLPSWYDGIAPVYDRAIRNLYLPYRRLAVEMLELQPGQTVVDLGCGSGLNFELVRERIGAEGSLIGVDSHPAAVNFSLRAFRSSTSMSCGSMSAHLPKRGRRRAVS